MIEWTKVESLEIIDRDTGKPLPIDNFYSLGKGTTLKLKAEDVYKRQVFYTEITNVYWHLDAVFNDANGRISKENMRAFGSGQDTVINDTTLGNKTTKLNNELFRADSSIENALVNQLNLGKPSVSNYPALSWSNQEGSSPYFSDSDTYKVVLKDTYLQLHKNETAQLETQLIPFIAGKNIDIKFSKISGSDSISVNAVSYTHLDVYKRQI